MHVHFFLLFTALPISSWMKLFKSLCSTNSIVEVFDIVNGMVFVDENAEETAEVGAPCSIADLEKCHHHLYCLRAKGICRTLSHALAGTYAYLMARKLFFFFSFFFFYFNFPPKHFFTRRNRTERHTF